MLLWVGKRRMVLLWVGKRSMVVRRAEVRGMAVRRATVRRVTVRKEVLVPAQARATAAPSLAVLEAKPLMCALR